MNQAFYPGRLAVQQRVLPKYRTAFFDELAKACQGGLSVFAGDPLLGENISPAEGMEIARFTRAHNRHFLNPGSPFYQCWQDGIIFWLESWNPGALIVDANPRVRTTHQAVRWMHARGKPVLGWGLGAPLLKGVLAGWRGRSRWNTLKSLDGLIAYSQRGAEEYRLLGFPGERIFVAPNAVASSPKHPIPDRPAYFEGRPRVLFVGRLQGRKRVDHLIKACANLPEAIRPELKVVGDGPARQELENVARSIYPRAIFTGASFGEALEAHFLQADLFVLPGTGGLAVQQAMAFGLPVIVAEGDGTQDDLVRSANGWKIPADDQQALRNALEAALLDPQHLRALGRESYRIVAEEVNLERMVEVFIAALTSA